MSQNVGIFLSEYQVVWEVNSHLDGVASVEISHLHAALPVHFSVLGIISFQECQFNSATEIEVHRTLSEKYPEISKFEDAQIYFQKHYLLFQNSMFSNSSFLSVDVVNVARQIRIWHCDIGGGWKFTATKNTTLSVSVENTIVHAAPIHITMQDSTSAVLVSLNQSSLYDSIITQSGGMGSYSIQGSNFIQFLEPALNLTLTGNVKIENCTVIINETSIQTQVTEHLVGLFPVLVFGSQIGGPIGMKELCFGHPCRLVEITNSSFHLPASHKKFTSVIQTTMPIKLDHCTFTVFQTVTDSLDDFILLLFQLSSVSFTNVSIHSPYEREKFSVLVNGRQVDGNPPNVTGTLVCPTSYKGYVGQYLVSCVKSCTRSDEYSIERGHISVKNGWPQQEQMYSPQCLPCPIGAHCEGEIKATPNYWGYRDAIGHTVMIKCPDGYCCQDNTTCQEIYSCNEGRTGTLCGSCKPGLTESLLTPQCIPDKYCSNNGVMLVYLLAAMSYALILIFKDPVKKWFLKLFEKLYKNHCKKKQRTETDGDGKNDEEQPLKSDKKKDDDAIKSTGKPDRRSDRVSTVESASDIELQEMVETGNNMNGTSKTEHDDVPKPIKGKQKGKKVKPKSREVDSSSKYFLMLIYYIQDAGLFKFHLPGTEVKENWIDKALGFTPDLVSPFVQICVSSMIPVKKVVFKASFSVCTMAIIFLIFIINKILYRCSPVKEADLLRGYLLAYLLSLQKLVMATSSLSGCIWIGEVWSLFIQGDVSCYTWFRHASWGVAIVLVINCIFLSTFPLAVHRKLMTVKEFILATLFSPYGIGMCFLLVKKHRAQVRDLFGLHSDKSNQPDSEIDQKDHIETDNTDQSTLEQGATELSKSEQVVVDTLVKDYRGIEATTGADGKQLRVPWFFFVFAYRLSLIWISQFVTQSLIRLLFMILALVVIFVCHILLKPFKDGLANKIVRVTYIATLVIAMINMTRIYSSYFECEHDCQQFNTMSSFFNFAEDILLIYAPIIAVVIASIVKIVKFVKG